jgi:hypothetical protein
MSSSVVPTSELSPALTELHQRLLAQVPRPVAGLIEPLMKTITEYWHLAPNDKIIAALSGDLSTGDDFSALADRFRSFGLAAAANLAFEAAARIDFEDQSLKEAWGGAFNGQHYRQRMCERLLKCVSFSAIVETGTFRGSTTEFLADMMSVPVFSCELNERFFCFARMRLAAHKNVRLFCMDSREFLKEILAGNALADGPIFFYLDAHWIQDLPLWDEIKIILENRTNAVIMIDDFRVPGDVGFGYDDYGPGKRLSLPDLRANLASETDLFFPRYPSGAETGAKRGVVVLAQHELADLVAHNVPYLERVDWRQAMLLDAIVRRPRNRRELLGVASDASSDRVDPRGTVLVRSSPIRAQSEPLDLKWSLKIKCLEMLCRDKDREIATLTQQRREQTRLIEKLILQLPDQSPMVAASPPNVVPQTIPPHSALRGLVLRTLPPRLSEMLAKIGWLRRLARRLAP